MPRKFIITGGPCTGKTSVINELGKELIIIGEGSEYKRLKKVAKNNIKFLGWQSTDDLKKYYAMAKALIFPGEEDFGIIPVEAQASGTPVIGYGKGGLLETTIKGKTGLFFNRQDYKEIINIVENFESSSTEFDPYEIRNNSMKFSKKNFENKLSQFLEEKYQEYYKIYLK